MKGMIMSSCSNKLTYVGSALLIFNLLALPGLVFAGDQQDTSNGSSLKVEADTEQAKQFLTTGKNPYLGDKQAIAEGKKLYQFYSCTQCHGSQAQGQTAGGLTGPRFNHAKSANDKGMFEIIWFGTNGGMSGKGKGQMDPNNPNNGLSADEVLKVIAWIRSQGQAGK
jgi:cytochrome c-L